ncbi:hypothetical protein BGLA2_630005 [Burkholderia gladioli]|nr:hypothetical protein BGLA2_630005 [Burkholderia gladioli]
MNVDSPGPAPGCHSIRIGHSTDTRGAGRRVSWSASIASRSVSTP